MARWGRRLRHWARRNRLGAWLVVIAALLGLAYALALLTNATSRYAPSFYEPKDLERGRQVEQGTGGR